MSGAWRCFWSKHASLLPLDVSMRGDTVVEANLRRLYGFAQVPCDTILRRLRLDPSAPVHIRLAFQQVLQRAQRGKVLGRMAAWRRH